MDIIRMRVRELRILGLVKKAIDKKVRQKEAAEVLRLSERQIRRIVRRVRKEGERGVIHKSRGREARNKISGSVKEKVLRMYGKKYEGFGAQLFTEKLKAKEGIEVSRETIRGWLLREGLVKQSRRMRRHRLWRERKGYYGEMVQMDGSHHAWLEERGPRLVLMGYIDDATNRAYGRFYEYEGTIPALDSFKRYVSKHGLPQSVYLDRHSTYKTTHYDEWKAYVFGDEAPLSQFERSLKDLGVNVIHANSAPAKGRIERLFRTLQDRLVKELRLANAKTIKEANEILEKYLIEHNRRYTIEPAKAANLHRRAPSSQSLDEILCIKKEHPLRNDFTLIHEKKLYQITEYTGAKRIEVRERVDGTMVMMGCGRVLNYKQIHALPVKKRIRLSQKSPVRRSDKGRSWGSYKSRDLGFFPKP